MKISTNVIKPLKWYNFVPQIGKEILIVVMRSKGRGVTTQKIEPVILPILSHIMFGFAQNK